MASQSHPEAMERLHQLTFKLGEVKDGAELDEVAKRVAELLAIAVPNSPRPESLPQMRPPLLTTTQPSTRKVVRSLGDLSAAIPQTAISPSLRKQLMVVAHTASDAAKDKPGEAMELREGSAMVWTWPVDCPIPPPFLPKLASKSNSNWPRDWRTGERSAYAPGRPRTDSRAGRIPLRHGSTGDIAPGRGGPHRPEPGPDLCSNSRRSRRSRAEPRAGLFADHTAIRNRFARRHARAELAEQPRTSRTPIRYIATNGSEYRQPIRKRHNRSNAADTARGSARAGKSL